MLTFMLRVWAILFLTLLPLSVSSQTAGERRTLSIDEQPSWSGVGRLNNTNGGYCSAALIRPDVVLTAAHCVIDQLTNRPVPAKELRFVAGLRSGYYTANRRVVSAKVHPDWAGYSRGDKVIVPGDIAVVRLESAITRQEARAFGVGVAPQEGEDVTVLSYGRGRSNALSIQERCQVLRRFKASAELNCDSVKGTSGAPVFQGGRIVGVVSANNGEQQPRRTYAVLVDGAIGALIDGVDPGSEPGSQSPDQSNSPEQSSPSGDRARSLFRSVPPGGSRLPGGKTAPNQ